MTCSFFATFAATRILTCCCSADFFCDLLIMLGGKLYVLRFTLKNKLEQFRDFNLLLLGQNRHLHIQLTRDAGSNDLLVR